MFSKEYYIGTINYCQKRLDEMPVVIYGRHNDAEILRYRYKISNKVKEISPTSKYWNKCRQIADERLKLTELIKQIKAEYKNTWNSSIAKDMALYKTVNQIKHKLDTAFWESLSEEKTTYPNNTNYYHGEDHFRSRAELSIAIMLSEMNLTYRYDVKISAKGNTYFADFIVYLPQFGCCFIIEYLGKLNDPDYIDDNTPKIRNYSREGFFQGEEIIYLCGSDTRMPSADVIREQITAVINAIAKQHIIKK